MKYKDYYQALGVERDASPDEIKKAYRKLAHQYHPDVSKDPKGEERFKEVAEAYSTLKDPEKRREYDSLGRRRSGEDFTPPPEWQQHFGAGGGFGGGAGFGGGGGGFGGFDDVDLADILSAFTGGRRGEGRARGRENFPVPGQDFEVTVPVTLEQVYRGDEVEVSIEVPEYDEHGLPHRVPRTFRINIPKGATDGQRLRLPGKGGPGRNGGKPGDLYVKLQFKPHPLYRVEGHNLYLDLPLAPWEGALGAKILVPTLGGPVELTIKPGTTTGQRLRLARRGLPKADGSAGDMYAVVQIEVPKTLSPRERELYEELASVSAFNPRKRFPAGATA
jgi:curved DNA-binding protein